MVGVAGNQSWNGSSPRDALAPLTRAIRAALSNRLDQDLPRLFQADHIWGPVITVALENRISNLLDRALRAHGVQVPPEWQAQLDRYRAETFRINARNLATAGEMTAALQAAGVEVVVFKGPSQQQQLYGDPFTKPATDVDLLVPSRQYEKALKVLERTHRLDPDCATPWWRIFLGEQALRSPDGRMLSVDLHYRLQQPGCPSPKDIEGFLDRRETITVGAIKLPVLSAPDACLLTCLNVVKALVHREACGRYLVDLMAGVAALDDVQLGEFVNIARREGLAATVALSLQAAQAAFGFSDPRLETLSDEGSAAMDLTGMSLLPDSPETIWTKRRDILWVLCGRQPTVFVREAAWAFTSEMCRQFSHLTRGRQPEMTVEARSA